MFIITMSYELFVRLMVSEHSSNKRYRVKYDSLYCSLAYQNMLNIFRFALK